MMATRKRSARKAAKAAAPATAAPAAPPRKKAAPKMVAAHAKARGHWRAANVVQWQGDNLAEARRVHRKIRHFPADMPGPFPGSPTIPGDPRLHIDTAEGHTVLADVGDYVVKEGNAVRVLSPRDFVAAGYKEG